MPDSLVGQSVRRPARCEDCGAQNPSLIEQVNLALLTDEILDGDHDEQPIPTKWVCRHRGACEARVMLAEGASAEDAVAHIRERGTGE